MDSIRYFKNEVKDKIAISDFLKAQDFGLLGLVDDNKPYVVPLNYIYLGDHIYFHSAKAGKKWKLINKNSNAFFVVAKWYHTIPAEVSCDISTSYFSVMCEGTVHVVGNPDEQELAFNAFIKKYAPGAEHVTAELMNNYKSSLGANMALFSIDIKNISAKANPPTLKN